MSKLQILNLSDIPFLKFHIQYIVLLAWIGNRSPLRVGYFYSIKKKIYTLMENGSRLKQKEKYFLRFMTYEYHNSFAVIAIDFRFHV